MMADHECAHTAMPFLSFDLSLYMASYLSSPVPLFRRRRKTEYRLTFIKEIWCFSITTTTMFLPFNKQTSLHFEVLGRDGFPRP
jgi:hypothetical protein